MNRLFLFGWGVIGALAALVIGDGLIYHNPKTVLIGMGIIFLTTLTVSVGNFARFGRWEGTPGELLVRAIPTAVATGALVLSTGLYYVVTIEGATWYGAISASIGFIYVGLLCFAPPVFAGVVGPELAHVLLRRISR